MRLTLVRHTKVNIPDNICYGNIDVALADTFEKESQAVYDKLKNYNFDSIYSSPLKRCKQLAEKIAESQHKVILDNRLKELHFGDWEGKNWNDIQKHIEAEQFFSDYLNTPCPNGESFKDLWNRVKSFIDEKQIEHTQHKVLIVSHGGPIRILCSIIQNIDPQEAFKLKVEYGQIVEMEIKQTIE